MCASASDGSSFFWGKCWGSNMYNQLGNSSLGSSNYYPSYWISPPTTSGEPMYGSANPLQHLMQVSAGRWYSCAIAKGSGSATSGAVACWGYSAYGQIGIGANYNGNTAQARFIPSFP